MAKRIKPPTSARKVSTRKAQASIDDIASGKQFAPAPRPFLVSSPVDSDQRRRPPKLDIDPTLLDPDHRHRQLISDGRFLEREGILAGAADYKANFTVGWSWIPRYTGANPEFRKLANKLMETWVEHCDVRGASHSWQRNLKLLVRRSQFDGDMAIAVVRDQTNWPRMQLIEGHRIAQVGAVTNDYTMPFPTVLDGPYQGQRIHNGVIMDDYMRPLAYRVLRPGARWTGYGVGVGQYDDIPAKSMRLFYNPRFATTARGIPSVCHGIEDWYDLFDTTDAEKIAAKVNAMLSIIKKNDTGNGPPMSNIVNGITVSNRPQVEQLAGGMIQYISHSDELFAHTSNRPSGGFQWLIDHLVRRGLMGMGIPIDACYDMSKLGSASVRGVFQAIGRTVEDEQQALHSHALWVVRFAIGTFIASGRLPFVRDWYSWGFTLPANASIDAGRDANADRQDYTHGTTALEFIAGKQGRSTEELAEARANDWLTCERIATEMKVPFDYVLPPLGRGIQQQYEQIEPEEEKVDNQEQKG